MMAARWADIERGLASSRRHFAMAIEAFVEVRNAPSDRERYFRRGAFMHAMLAGYTSFENAMKDLIPAVISLDRWQARMRAAARAA